MSLPIDLSALAHLDRIRSALADNDPTGRFAPLGLHQLTISDVAIDELTATVERHLARTGRTNGAPARVRVIVDPVTIRRDGEDLKRAVVDRLSERFDVALVTLDDAHPSLHADEAILERAAAGVAGADCVVSVGGGTITDIAKIAAERAGAPVHVVVQTAASVDGYTDNFSVVLQQGVKRTLLSRWPDAVLTDSRTIAEAPHVLNASGFGELLSMFSAPGDLFLASVFGVDDSFSPVLVELLEPCGEGIEEWSGGVGRGELDACRRLASALAMRGIVTGVGGTTALLSGAEHLISHMLDVHHAERGEPTGLHGAQVGIASVYAAAAWEEFCRRMDETPLDPADLFGPIEAWEGCVLEAFASLDPSGRIGRACWTHYRAKLVKWHDNRAKVRRFFEDWPANRAGRDELVVGSRPMAVFLYRADAPMRHADLDPPPSAELMRWAVGNCQFMRERFTVADLLAFAGWWDDEGVARVFGRVEAACAAAERTGR